MDKATLQLLSFATTLSDYTLSNPNKCPVKAKQKGFNKNKSKRKTSKKARIKNK